MDSSDNTITTFTADSHLYGGDGVANYDQYPGSVVSRDLMNSGNVFPVGQQTRQLISDHDLDVLETAYGYTVNSGSLRHFTPVNHEIGTFRPPSSLPEIGVFDLRYADGSSTQFGFQPTDTRAVAGDWDGDGFDEVGSYYAPSGLFRLRDANGNPTSINFGGPNSYPVAGDWNGDGRDEIGVYYPSLARFDLRVNASTTITISSFGGSTYKPVAGDWDGDGVDELGLYDANQALFRIWKRDGTKFSITMGGSLAHPLAGDWDGDGDDEVGTYFRNPGRFVLRSNNNPADNTKTTIDFGGINTTKLPVAGNWL